jgi:hypothetical protein
VRLLVAGALLCSGRRTVCAALRVFGLAEEGGFGRFHRVLSRARWSAREASRILLGILLERLLPEGPVVVLLDDTIERRWGRKIEARGIYRDPVRSSRGHFVKTSGLRWLCFTLSAPVPWAGRCWALPFLTLLCPSERWAAERGVRYKSLLDWARQGVLQVRRWLGEARALVVVADSGFAALDWLDSVRTAAVVVARLRLDAALYEDVPPRRPGQLGWPRKKGARLPTLAAVAEAPETLWREVQVSPWYGESTRTVEIATGEALWTASGRAAVPIRWVLVRDPAGQVETKAFLSTDRQMDALEIVRLFVRRWQTEVTSRGGAAAPGRGEPAAVVECRHRPHHALPAGPLQRDHPRGRCPGEGGRLGGGPGNLVPQGAADLQRRPRRGTPRALGCLDFRRLGC